MSRALATTWTGAMTLALVLLPISAAEARRPPDSSTTGSQTNGTRDGNEISASAQITYDLSKNGTGPSAGAMTPQGTWTPPPCWYGPAWTPTQFKTERESLWSQPYVGNIAQEKQTYEYGHPYKDFNIANEGKGMWWWYFVNADYMNDPRSSLCEKLPFWVDNGKPANVENAVSPEILAELAYGKIRVPDTKASMNPAGTQTVNLPTWVWLDKTEFKPVSVTAKIDALNMSATTTATPVALHIDPGTPDADSYPASGDCPINADGSIGTPYNGDTNATPPCGATYRRSTTNSGPFPFKATLTWKVSWKGSDGTGGNLPDGTFSATTPVTVQEIQTVVH